MKTCRLVLSLLLGTVVCCKATEDGASAPEFDQTIRGGEHVSIVVPWFVLFEDNVLCSGALVHEDIVVTTASCVTRGHAPSQVRIGSLGRFDGGNIRDVETSMVHPDYTGDETAGADVAVLKLRTTIGNTLAILNTDGNITATAKLYVLGFGLLNNEELPKGLQGLFYDYVEFCEERYPLYNPTKHLCADASPDRGACDGDTGSPAVLADSRILVGLSSFSDNFCESQTYDVYTRISTYQPWIQSAICILARNRPSPECDEAPCLFFSWSGFQQVRQRVQHFFGF